MPRLSSLLRMLAVFFLPLGMITPSGPAFANTKEEAQGTKRILLLIGYTDGQEHESLKDLFRYAYSANLSANLEHLVRNGLEALGFDERSPGFFFEAQKQIEVAVMNSNTSCGGDSEETHVYIPCPRQLERSKFVIDHLNRELRTYDEFFYIGHARRGLGLAVGPFTRDTTFPLFFHNDIELGRIRKVVMAACDSERLYRHRIAARDKVDFRGVDGAKRLQTELMPFLLGELARSVLAHPKPLRNQ